MPKLIYTVPSGHNPGGVALSLDRRRHMLEIASRYDVLILEDDPYQLLRLGDAPRLPTLQSLDREGRRVAWQALVEETDGEPRYGLHLLDLETGERKVYPIPRMDRVQVSPDGRYACGRSMERGEEGRWQPMHHPFTAPKDKDIPLLDSAPAEVQAKHYDLVCNGCELSSGSVRIHTRELQQKIFGLLGYSRQEIESRFGHLIEAFEYGAPPHAGIAPGIDRVVMLLAGEETIREVIPFPKNKSAIDVMFDAPSEVTEEQLKELHLKLRPD